MCVCQCVETIFVLKIYHIEINHRWTLAIVLSYCLVVFILCFERKKWEENLLIYLVFHPLSHTIKRLPHCSLFLSSYFTVIWQRAIPTNKFMRMAKSLIEMSFRIVKMEEIISQIEWKILHAMHCAYIAFVLVCRFSVIFCLFFLFVLYSIVWLFESKQWATQNANTHRIHSFRKQLGSREQQIH